MLPIKNRVKYRKEQLELKRLKTIEREFEKKQQLDEKKEILEEIRRKVRPQVDGDLMRLWKNTIAWSNKLDKFQEKENKLFSSVNTFSSEQLRPTKFQVTIACYHQITADPRFRLEERLRNTGLLNSEYARSVLANTNPIRQPRRDIVSSNRGIDSVSNGLKSVKRTLDVVKDVKEKENNIIIFNLAETDGKDKNTVLPAVN
ncbi:hypothetical protein HELRODRAFT_158681 [Helobdella robusta]|uniref:Uncharacterized protein n=1 Tax=Helobdella robusta TaxID=6412 RepID=T1EN45_HELRO|nr:hypothetical protein HELRODRAFT_158681 [Helobdella robusta]ESO12214.1 hypothetical protein HELRODRAFT_158681 [Helobdella robusta]